MGLNTFLKIELDGQSAGVGANGLNITAGNSRVRGMEIMNFDSGIRLDINGANIIEGNFFGPIALSSGQGGGSNDCGVTSLSSGNTIGGVTAAARNVISLNNDGICINGAGGTTVQGNLIGTNPGGTEDWGNGVGVSLLAPGNTIGGTVIGAGNVISGNNFGVNVNSTGNQLQGNYIGTGVSGSTSLGNATFGVAIASSNTVGGSASGAGNIIAFNGSDGLWVGGSGSLIAHNSIHSNGGLGIDLAPDAVSANDVNDSDTGANNLQNFPVLASALCCGSGGTVIGGSLNSTAGTQFTIEFFGNPTCDASGNGEGQLYLGSTTVTTVGNDATISVTLASTTPGDFITATARRTVASLDASEFSACRVVELDSDGDAVVDASDNCPAWANASQALPVWVVPANDPDCDGFDTPTENGMTTNASLHCGANAWPPDFNDSMSVVLQDVLLLKPHFGTAPPRPDYSVRFDLNANGTISLQDVLIVKPFFGLNCP